MSIDSGEQRPAKTVIETSPERFLAPYEKIGTDEPGIVLLGASGVGKSTLRNMLCGQTGDGAGYVKHMRLSTRPPHPNEDQEYDHVTPGVMDAIRGNQNVLLDSKLYGNEYMTLWPEKLPPGNTYIYIYRPQAALELRQTFPNLKFVHIAPANVSNLSDRIVSRNPDITPDELQIRLAEIDSEIAQCSEIADATVVNNGAIENVAIELRRTMDRLIASPQ